MVSWRRRRWQWRRLSPHTINAMSLPFLALGLAEPIPLPLHTFMKRHRIRLSQSCSEILFDEFVCVHLKRWCFNYFPISKCKRNRISAVILSSLMNMLNKCGIDGVDTWDNGIFDLSAASIFNSCSEFSDRYMVGLWPFLVFIRCDQ